MAGHSRWANIRHRKERADAKKGKLFSRLIKEVAVAARIGGADIESNPRLRLAVDKARVANVPSGNLERAVKRGGGQLEGVNFDEIRYEGYGPGGVAVIVDCLTDNKNRSLAEVRHAFAKNGGNLGAAGSVAYLFRRCGILLFAPGGDAEKIVEAAIENGAQDFAQESDGSVEVIADAGDFHPLLAALEAAGFKPDEAEIVMRADSEVELPPPDAAKTRRLLDALEDIDDAQQVHSNFAEERPS